MRRRTPILLGCLLGMLQGVPQDAGAQRATGFENPYYTTGAEIAPSTLVPSVPWPVVASAMYANQCQPTNRGFLRTPVTYDR